MNARVVLGDAGSAMSGIGASPEMGMAISTLEEVLEVELSGEVEPHRPRVGPGCVDSIGSLALHAVSQSPRPGAPHPGKAGEGRDEDPLRSNGGRGILDGAGLGRLESGFGANEFSSNTSP